MTLSLTARSEPCDAGCRGVHSYSDDGRRACWRGAAPAAIDIERAACDVPDALAARFPLHATPTSFWPAWTRAEALAKLTDVPILVWLSTRGLDAPTPAGVGVRRLDVDGLVVTLAERQTAQEAA